MNNSASVHEFFSPFAHIPGRYEWCRIISPTHGVFDCFIVLGESTAVAATVYVNGSIGQRFMQDRYPESECILAKELELESSADGRVIQGRLVANAGPVREATMILRGDAEAVPAQVPYGGDGSRVWGSQFTCTGVDLTIPATCDGTVTGPDEHETFDAHPAVVALGSFGKIEPV